MCHPACVGEDGPDGEDRVLAHAKSNSGALAPSLRYRIEGHEVEHGCETIPTCAIAWLGDAEGVSASDMLTDQEPEEQSARHEASEWLRSYLHDRGGAAPAGDVIKAAGRDGIASRTLQRSRKRARVETSRTKDAWTWALEDAPESSTDQGASQGATPSDTLDLGALPW